MYLQISDFQINTVSSRTRPFSLFSIPCLAHTFSPLFSATSQLRQTPAAILFLVLPPPHFLGLRPRPLAIRLHLRRVVLRRQSTRLPHRIPRRNALHDDRRSKGTECIAPRQIAGRVVARCVAVPLDDLLERRQAGRLAGLEVFIVGLGGRAGGRCPCPRPREIDEIAERVADGGHLPVENADDARLGFVEDHVVDFVVAVDQCGAVFRLSRFVLEELQHLVDVRDGADGDVGFDVGGLGLVRGEGREGLDLAVVEVGVAAEGGHVDGGVFVVDAVEGGEGFDC